MFLKRALDDVTTANFSLPTQRCFLKPSGVHLRTMLFSAYAEVFPGARPPDPERTPFLCLRRGVSEFGAPLMRRQTFSLPTQRCFSVSPRVSVIDWLFSAYAEVFPPPKSLGRSPRTFLCLRRGVSYITEPAEQMDTLFSAYAEVFLA